MPRSTEEHAPLEECYIQSFDSGDDAFPIVARKVDPRDPGYAVPADLSLCTDPRYPLHKFTGVTPIADDRRVLWIYRLLPGPLLTGQHLSPDTGILDPFTRQEIAANTADGTALTEITPKDAVIDAVETTIIPTAALDAFSTCFPDYADLPLPNVLTALAVEWEKSEAHGAYTETGSGTSYTTDGTSLNLSVSMNGSAQGGGGVVAELIPTYAPQRGAHRPVLDYYFYIPHPASHAAVLAKMLTLTAAAFAVQSVAIATGVVSAAGHSLSNGEPFQFPTLVGIGGSGLAVNTTYYAQSVVGGVRFRFSATPGGAAILTGSATSGTAVPVFSAWPNFRPVEETVILKGEKRSVSPKVTAKNSLSISNTQIGETIGHGSGSDKDVSSSIRAVVLKPSIHADIAISGNTSESQAISVDASATMTAGGGWSGAASSITAATSALGAVTPVSLPATPVTEIPTFGRYLLSMPMDLSKYQGYALVRARTVNFADV